MKNSFICIGFLLGVMALCDAVAEQAPGLRRGEEERKLEVWEWDCPEECTAWGWIHDGYCDDICNKRACNYDGGDCAGENEKHQRVDLEISACDTKWAGTTGSLEVTLYSRTSTQNPVVVEVEDPPERNEEKTYTFYIQSNFDLKPTKAKIEATSGNAFCLWEFGIYYDFDGGYYDDWEYLNVSTENKNYIWFDDDGGSSENYGAAFRLYAYKNAKKLD